MSIHQSRDREDQPLDELNQNQADQVSKDVIRAQNTCTRESISSTASNNLITKNDNIIERQYNDDLYQKPSSHEVKTTIQSDQQIDDYGEKCITNFLFTIEEDSKQNQYSQASRDSYRNFETQQNEDLNLQTDQGSQREGIPLVEQCIHESQFSKANTKKRENKLTAFQYSESPTIQSQKQNLKKMRTDYFDKMKFERSSINNSPSYLTVNPQIKKKESSIQARKSISHQIVYNKYSYKLWRNSQVTPLDTSKNEEVLNLKKWNIVKRIGMALKVKQKFQSLISQRLHKLNSYERKLIGDITDTAYEKKLFKMDQNPIIQWILYTKFHPGSFAIILFKLLMLVITAYNIVYIPMYISFRLPDTPNQQLCHNISAILFLAEIFIKFRTAVYEKGEVLYSSYIIAKMYITSDFIPDLISLIGYTVGGTSQQFLLLIILVRLNNLMKYLDDINNHFYLTEKYYTFWVLTKLFALIMIMNHYFACVFHYIGISLTDDPELTTWINAQNLENQFWAQRYISALYFSFITCMTIGFGDIVPKNVYERIAVIVYSFFATILFSYSVNTIGNIFQDYYSKYQKQLY